MKDGPKVIKNKRVNGPSAHDELIANSLSEVGKSEDTPYHSHATITSSIYQASRSEHTNTSKYQLYEIVGVCKLQYRPC